MLKKAIMEYFTSSVLVYNMTKAVAVRGERFQANLPKLPDGQLMYFHPEKWVGEGVLSKWTPEVVDFAQQFDTSTLEGVKRLCTAVQNFKPISCP